MSDQTNNYDVLVVGGGIAGEETALNLANIGYKIIMVEKDLSIGGKMIHLSKVFPTLDCSACITTPKVSETARHPNISIFTNSEVGEIEKISENNFTAILTQKPRYVTEDCTGCQLCEEACPVSVEDQFQYELVGRKAAYIPFSIANPRIAAIDIENCILCGLCEKVCPADCIDFTQEAIKTKINIKSVVMATGYQIFDPTIITRYGFGKFKNVVTAMQMERQLVPTRPFNAVLRPKDGKMPDNIAYVLCTGSRDDTVGNPICSQVCCMYSTKQAQLLMGALPMADVTIYYIHVRAFGKGFCEFYNQTVGMGVEYIKGKIGKIDEAENGDLIVRYEDIESGKVKEAKHDLVVLATGILANRDYQSMFKNIVLEPDKFNYVKQVNDLSSPSKTSIGGVFVAGTASGPMDIPDSILSAGAASAETASYLRRAYNEK
ncbi:MAG: CoB--CoM heterodisulfide reductase iron-sulfur subunit A family protein [Bacteroidales bacterium]|nr:CoB--CoM heterodisulfide reductase iron-sulfur subunit A family protein [Bacteroidales bacterium]MBN2755693.1 CoB--CoM heterodisulfide reductase iron-sulfur subunit A family protein [Bacteroidales bacterium]